jgi:hypothetical protein
VLQFKPKVVWVFCESAVLSINFQHFGALSIGKFHLKGGWVASVGGVCSIGILIFVKPGHSSYKVSLWLMKQLFDDKTIWQNSQFMAQAV